MDYESSFTQEVVLPSRGLLNPEIPEGKLVQRCMMVADQKYLAGSNAGAGNQINQVLQRTTTEPKEFDINALTLPDTLYLLFKLRILSYGNEYKFITRCPECGRKITVTADLSNMQVITLEDDYAEQLVVELPHRKDKVYTKLLTNADIDEMNKEIDRRRRKNPNDESAYILRIAYSIEKVVIVKEKKELTHPIDIERYINGLTDLDAASIIATRDSIEFGVDTSYDTECPECRRDITVNMNFTREFFRPNFSKH